MSRVELVVVGRDGLSWKTRDQARLSDRGISVREWARQRWTTMAKIAGIFC